MRLPPRPPSQGNCSRQGETRCRPRSFFAPRSARGTEEVEKWCFQRTRDLMTPRALRGMAVNDVGRARISMMVRSMSSNSRPDTLVQARTPPPHRFFLQRTAGPYIGVNSGVLDAVGLGEEQLQDPRHPDAAVNRRVQLINIGRKYCFGPSGESAKCP